MQTLTNITQFLLSLLTLALITWLGWQGYLFIAGEQEALAPEMQSLLIIIAIIILVAAYMIARALRNASVTNSQGRRKANLYETYITNWLKKREQELTESGADNKVAILLLSSPQVVTRIKHLEATSKKEGYDSDNSIAAFKALLMAMRADLGLNSFYNTRKEMEQLLTKEQTYAE